MALLISLKSCLDVIRFKDLLKYIYSIGILAQAISGLEGRLTLRDKPQCPSHRGYQKWLTSLIRKVRVIHSTTSAELIFLSLQLRLYYSG